MYGKKSKLRKYQVKAEDFVSLTAITSPLEKDQSRLKRWLGEASTVEFLGTWEIMFNPDFDLIGFEKMRSLASTGITPEQWITATGAIGLLIKQVLKGTAVYAHRDIAFEFGAWLNPQFRLYLVSELRRLQAAEGTITGINSTFNMEFHFGSRECIDESLLIQREFTLDKNWLTDVGEQDLVNIAAFGWTEEKWRSKNPALAASYGTIRNSAGMNGLIVVSNLEYLNEELIKSKVGRRARFKELRQLAMTQFDALNKYDLAKSIKPDPFDSHIDSTPKSNSGKADTFGDAIRSILQAGKPVKKSR